MNIPGKTLVSAWIVVLVVALTAGNCTRDDSGPAAPEGPNRDGVVEVRLLPSLRFDPAELAVEPGTTVRWINATNLFHTISPDGHSEWERFETSREGEVFEHTFEDPGEFAYLCEPHLSFGMTGSVTVR